MKKSIFFLLIPLFMSCKKDHMELVHYDVHTYTGCIWADIEYLENGITVKQTNQLLSAWYHEFFRQEGTDLYLKVTPLCSGGEATIYVKVNGNLMNDTRGSDIDPAIIRVEAKRIDDFYR